MQLGNLANLTAHVVSWIGLCWCRFAGVGKMTWLIDFEGYSMRNAPAVRTSLGVLHILQNHYPERLGGAVCYHAPGLFSMTWKVWFMPG
jgi:hypothetical protein